MNTTPTIQPVSVPSHDRVAALHGRQGDIRGREIQKRSFRGFQDIRGRGLTLAEMIVTIMIMAIVAAVALPLLSSTDQFALPYAAQIMQRDFEYAQMEAQRRSDLIFVAVYPGTEQYNFLLASSNYRTWLPHPFWSNADRDGSGNIDIRDVAGANDIDIISATLDNANFFFQFDANGEPVNYPDTSLPIQGTRKVVLGQGDRRYSLEVTPIIGNVKIYEGE